MAFGCRSATLAAFSLRAWESQVDDIAASDASPISKGDRVDALAKDYLMTATDITDQTAYLAEQVRTRSIAIRSGDKPFMFRAMFIARTLFRAVDERHVTANFANNVWKVARDLGRGTETADSNFIQVNLARLDEVIAENDW